MENLKVGSRVVLTKNLPALKLGVHGTVIAMPENGKSRVVFDMSQVGRGFVGEINPEDLAIESPSFTDGELDKFFTEQFKKQRPIIPQEITLTDEETLAVSVWEMTTLTPSGVIYSIRDDSQVAFLKVAFSSKDVYQFGRLINVKTYLGFNIE